MSWPSWPTHISKLCSPKHIPEKNTSFFFLTPKCASRNSSLTFLSIGYNIFFTVCIFNILKNHLVRSDVSMLKAIPTTSRRYLSSPHYFSKRFSSHFKFIVAGGGAGGCATASKLTRHGTVAVIDPADVSLFMYTFCQAC